MLNNGMAVFLVIALLAGSASAFCILDWVCFFEPGKPVVYFPPLDAKAPEQGSAPGIQQAASPAGGLVDLPCSATIEDRIRIWNQSNGALPRAYDPRYYACIDDCGKLNSDPASTQQWYCNPKYCICNPRTVNNGSSGYDGRLDSPENQPIYSGVKCVRRNEMDKNSGFMTTGSINFQPAVQQDLRCKVELENGKVWYYDVKKGANYFTFSVGMDGGAQNARVKCWALEDGVCDEEKAPAYETSFGLECLQGISCANGLNLGKDAYGTPRIQRYAVVGNFQVCKDDCNQKQGTVDDWKCQNREVPGDSGKVDCVCECNEAKKSACLESGGTWDDGFCRCSAGSPADGGVDITAGDIMAPRGTQFDIFAHVENNGKTRAGGQYATFTIGTSSQRVEVPSLGPGEGATLSVKAMCGVLAATPYSVSLDSGQSAAASVNCISP